MQNRSRSRSCGSPDIGNVQRDANATAVVGVDGGIALNQELVDQIGAAGKHIDIRLELDGRAAVDGAFRADRQTVVGAGGAE